jgi:Uma2 family endonuclease
VNDEVKSMNAFPAIAAPTLLSEAEYELLGDQYEIMEGELVEREPMSSKSVVARDNLFRFLDKVVLSQKNGYLFGDGMIYYMWKTEKGIRGAFIPDISFIRKEKRLKEWTLEDNYPGAPDLAIEVLSPSNDADTMLQKVRLYLERGTEQVWLVYPEAAEIHLYLRDNPQQVRVYRGTEKLDASAFFPGVAIAIADLFVLPELG